MAVRDIIREVGEGHTLSSKRYSFQLQFSKEFTEIQLCLISQGLHPPVLIFVQSKERSKELYQELLYDGINVDVIHADRNQTEVSYHR